MLQHEPCKHSSKWKKPLTEDHIWYDSIYVRSVEKANP